MLPKRTSKEAGSAASALRCAAKASSSASSKTRLPSCSACDNNSSLHPMMTASVHIHHALLIFCCFQYVSTCVIVGSRACNDAKICLSFACTKLSSSSSCASLVCRLRASQLRVAPVDASKRICANGWLLLFFMTNVCAIFSSYSSLTCCSTSSRNDRLFHVCSCSRTVNEFCTCAAPGSF